MPAPVPLRPDFSPDEPLVAPPVPPDPLEYERDPYGDRASFEAIDRALQAAVAHATGGVSPRALIGAFADWWLHLATSPGKQLLLAEKARR
jgi:polyhydroxyalkanoate synthase subunit PhaC